MWWRKQPAGVAWAWLKLQQYKSTPGKRVLLHARKVELIANLSRPAVRPAQSGAYSKHSREDEGDAAEIVRSASGSLCGADPATKPPTLGISKVPFCDKERSEFACLRPRTALPCGRMCRAYAPTHIAHGADAGRQFFLARGWRRPLEPSLWLHALRPCCFAPSPLFLWAPSLSCP